VQYGILENHSAVAQGVDVRVDHDVFGVRAILVAIGMELFREAGAGSGPPGSA